MSTTATLAVTYEVPLEAVQAYLRDHPEVLLHLTTNGYAPTNGALHATTNGHAATPTQEDAAPVLPSSTGAP